MDMAAMRGLIVDSRARGIFRVNRQVFTDSDIPGLERRRVFDQSWFYVGHESEIATPGDFITRRVGGRPSWSDISPGMGGAAGTLVRERRAVLDLETLRPRGKLGFIL